MLAALDVFTRYRLRLVSYDIHTPWVFHGEELYRAVGLWTDGCAFPLSPRPA